MTKFYLSLSDSLQRALQAAQRLIWEQFRSWTLFVGLEEPQNVAQDQRQVVVHLTDETGEDIEVLVYLVKGDSGWRAIQSSLIKKGEWTVSTQRFDSSRITYDNVAEREQYATKNERYIGRLNAGQQFAFITDRYGQLSGTSEPIDPYYAFVMMRDGELLPLPIFFEAAGIEMLTAFGRYQTHKVTEDGRTFEVIDWHEATEAEIDAYLRQSFGSQYLKTVSDRSEIEMLVLVKIEGREVTVSKPFGAEAKPVEAVGRPIFDDHMWNHEVDEVHMVNGNWVILMLLLGIPVDTVLLRIETEDVELLKAALDKAYVLRSQILEKLGHWPQELSEIWEVVRASEHKELVTAWGQRMLIFARACYWPDWALPLWRDASGRHAESHMMFLDGGKEMVSDWPQNTEWLVEHALAWKRTHDR